jgi:hypothetical protein
MRHAACGMLAQEFTQQRSTEARNLHDLLDTMTLVAQLMPEVTSILLKRVRAVGPGLQPLSSLQVSTASASASAFQAHKACEAFTPCFTHDAGTADLSPGQLLGFLA